MKKQITYRIYMKPLSRFRDTLVRVAEIVVRNLVNSNKTINFLILCPQKHIQQHCLGLMPLRSK